eukprot:CAMPEP_0185571762 /NCGR_PEP_ID=MMETSP0434-20130131/3765_1 /TAXON_ID=626734 ORGANISM="Favella taraikaensis, Strain Fe Narragansett Bay" /NCGR_SAMPLE_ID=MMETSP0434 /ASSEMBLY_ACC=CAM_ASM_000379 /LENGTH=184 /DNA_ID=CAMNT_0028187347 /DNA_START=455 /DNA_END=1007 /DNA_ORIENTATION=-
MVCLFDSVDTATAQEEDAEAEVGKLDITVWTAQDVIRLNVPMQHVLRVHSGQAFSYLVQAPAHEILTEVAFALDNNIRETAALHELKDDPDAPIEVPHAFTLDQLLTVEMLDQAAFVDHVLPLGRVFRLRVLEGVVLVRFIVDYLVDRSESTGAEFAQYLELAGRIFSLDLTCLVDHGANLLDW